MMQLLPTEILDWVNPKGFNLDSYSNNCPISCLLEVDLDYLDELYDLQKDYPLACKNAEVTKVMMSKYQLQIKKDIFSLGKNKKLHFDLPFKRKHKFLYQNLQISLKILQFK